MYNSFSFFRLRILSYYLPAQEIYTSPYSWQTNPEKITGSIPYSETKFKGQLLRYCAKQISFSGTKLPIEKIETEACSQPPIDEAEIIKLIERRGLGGFVPFTADISPRLGISRSLACIHPADPGYFYKFVGIGIAHEQDNNIEIEPPTTARRMNDLPLQQGVMSQVIVMPDGSLLKSSDDSGLGGIEPDSGVFKIIKTAKNKYYLVEINPRIPAWVYLAVGVGQNLPEALVKLALGKKVEPFQSYDIGKMFIRHSWDMIVPIEQFQTLSSLGEL